MPTSSFTPNASSSCTSRRLSSPSSTSPPGCLLDPQPHTHSTPPIPIIKHIHLPPLPPTSPLAFEIILAFHGLLFYALQLLHLYRTVWWLPQSFNSGGGGVHLHLISPHLAAIILTVVCRRGVYLALVKVIPRSQRVLGPGLAIGMFALICWNAVRIEHLTWVRVVYLLGPVPVHLYTYGATLTPLFDPPDYDPVQPPEPSGQHHTCSTIPTSIRQECEQLRMQFNRRIKSVFYACFVTVYYGCFIPWGFCKPTIHYDLPFVTQHLLLASCYTFTLISSRSFCPDITDRMHKVAVHLGAWRRVPGSVGLLQQAQQWNPNTTYLPSTLVSVTVLSRKHLYRSAHSTPIVMADPLNTFHGRFHSLFSSSTFPRLLLGFHLAIELLTLLILFKTTEWYQLISVTALLVTSTPTLIRLGRDFLVVWKLYRAEEYLFGSAGG